MVATASTARYAFDESIAITSQNGTLNELSDDLSRAIDQALWALDFRGDLDEALDGALLRSILAGTPTLSGGLLAASI